MKVNAKMRVIVIGLCTVFVATVIILCCALPSCGSKLDFNTTFYYVCYDTPSDAHSASSMSSVVHSYGGAGYIISHGGKHYVTVSCYYNQMDAETVANTLNRKGLKCSVLGVDAGDFRLRGSSKRNGEKYVGNFNTMLELSKICYGLANSLDNYSCGQDAAKSLLSDVKNGLEGLARQNAANCFAEELNSLIAECMDVSHGYVFSYDVRRLQIAITDSITNVKLY